MKEITLAAEIKFQIPHPKRCEYDGSRCRFFDHIFVVLGPFEYPYRCHLFGIDKRTYTRLPECMAAEVKED